MQPYRVYVEQVFKRWNRIPAWLPDRELALGDMGYETAAGFDRVGNVADLGISLGAPRIETGGTTRFSLAYKSNVKDRVAADVKLGPAALLGGVAPETKVVFSFEAGGGFTFDAIECQTHSVEDHISLGDKLIALGANGAFDRSMVVVTELIVAQSLLVLISGAEGGEVELKIGASASLPLTTGLPQLALADASTHIEFGSQTGMNITVARRGRSSPLFSARRIRRRILRRPVFKLEVQKDRPTQGSPQNELEFALAVPSLGE
jgi:hypothetical protein